MAHPYSGSLPVSNNLMQIYSAGEISGDYYMQIEPSLYHQPEMSKKENVNIYPTSVIRQSREELEQ